MVKKKKKMPLGVSADNTLFIPGIKMGSVCYPDNKLSDLAFSFTPGIFNGFSLSSMTSDLCPPEQNLRESNLWRRQISPGLSQDFGELLSWRKL